MREINDDTNGYDANGFRNEIANGETSDSANGTRSPGLLAGIAADVASQKMRVPQDLSLIAQLAETQLKGGLIDDKRYLVSLLSIEPRHQIKPARPKFSLAHIMEFYLTQTLD
jgi:hypothetical protein